MTSPLPTRPLGSSGLEISPVGFGASAIRRQWNLGWEPQDDAASLAMRRALQLGVNWIDTAAVDGLGHSEELVGRLLKELAPEERPLVFTRGGLVWSPEFQPRLIRAEVEASLRRLGVERIDLYQFHWADDTGTLIEDSWETMARLVEEGKIRAAGISTLDVSLLERCEAVRHVDVLQAPFSLIRREAGEYEIPWCAEHHTDVICYSPLQSGILTEGISVSRVAALPAQDWRRSAEEFQYPRLSRNLALRDALQPIARSHETTVAAVAISWVLAWPGVSGATVGARSAAQVDDWIGGATLELSTADFNSIRTAIARTGAGMGPLRLPQIGRGIAS